MTASPDLQAYAANVTSQFGEDGIIAEILLRIGAGNRICVEFGAWDGRHFSNTWVLWHEQGWSAVLIEGEPRRCNDLRTAVAAYPKVEVIEAFVGWQGPQRLDALLARTNLPPTIDVLSIDIDGDDYHVLAALEVYLPRLLLVEFNPTCPPGLELVQEPGGGRFGSSARSLLQLAERKDYRLAACTETNLILVRRDEFHQLGIPPVTLEAIMPRKHLVNVVTDYDGRSMLTGVPVYAPELPKLGWRKALASDSGKWPAFKHGQVIPVQLHRAGK